MVRTALFLLRLLKQEGATQGSLFGGVGVCVGDVVNNIYPLCLAQFLRDDKNYYCNETSQKHTS